MALEDALDKMVGATGRRRHERAQQRLECGGVIWRRAGEQPRLGTIDVDGWRAKRLQDRFELGQRVAGGGDLCDREQVAKSAWVIDLGLVALTIGRQHGE